MQPSLLLPIILKDFRANRLLLAIFFALTALDSDSTIVMMLSLIFIGRLVNADPPGSDTAFLATRPVSGTTLFFAKLLLTMVALVLIPSAIDAVAKLLTGFEPSAVLTSIFRSLYRMYILSFFFALAVMMKKLRWVLFWYFVSGFIITLVIASILIIAFPFWKSPNWAELAGIYSFLVSGGNFLENRVLLLAGAVSVVPSIAFLGITWQYYARPNTLRTALFLFVGVILSIGFTGFFGYWEILNFSKEAKSSNFDIPMGYLDPKLTNLYPTKPKITEEKTQMITPKPSMRGYFSFSNWPEDVHSMAVSDVSVSLSRDGQALTIPIHREELDSLSGIWEIFRNVKISNQSVNLQDIVHYPAIFSNTLPQKEIPINFSWPPPGLKNALSPDTGDLTLRMDLTVFQYKNEAILPLHVGETARFGNHIATVRNVTQHSHHCKCCAKSTNPSTSSQSVTVEIDQSSAFPSLTEPVYRLKTRAGFVEASKSIFTSRLTSFGGVKKAKVTLTFSMPSTMEDQTDGPLDEEAMRQRMTEWLKDAELVVSKIVPAGTIQREMPITGEARMRFLNVSK